MPTPPGAAGFQAAALPASAPSRRPRAAAEDVFYPSSDGRPMSENMWQGKAIIAAAGDLEVALPDALVAPDILVYPERGNNKKSRAPDVLVALDIGKHLRSSYYVWEEGKPPDWVLEVASPSTKNEDLGAKLRDYLAMRVPEYWLFDPKGDQFPKGMPRLQGLTLVDGMYLPIPSRAERGMAVIRSDVLGLDVRCDGHLLRFSNPATGEDIRHQAESEEAVARVTVLRKEEMALRKKAEALRKEEEARRKEAEALREEEEARRKEAEALRREEEARRKEEEALRKEEGARRKEEEALRKQEEVLRKAAELRVAELEAALRRTQGSPGKDIIE